MARDNKAHPALSIVGLFFPLPWLGYAVGSIARSACHLGLVVVRTHKVLIGAPPFQVGQQARGLLSRSPGATSQRRYSMADGQIHPLDKSGIEPA